MSEKCCCTCHYNPNELHCFPCCDETNIWTREEYEAHKAKCEEEYRRFKEDQRNER